MRNCERALRSLPAEDPRLKMKGRFFFDPAKKDPSQDKNQTSSNSILLCKGRTEIHWDEEENQLSASSAQQAERKRVITHQKICQTEESSRESIGTQAEPEMSDFWMQVSPMDLQPIVVQEDRFPLDSRHSFDDRRAIDDRRLIDERRVLDDRRQLDDRRLLDDRRALDDRRGMDDGRRLLGDRLDWNMRDSFDRGGASAREQEDLRWNLANRDRPMGNNPWQRGFSPNRQPMLNEHMQRSGPGIPMQNMDMQLDMRDRMMDRMDPREKDMRDRDMDQREQARLLELMRERERLMKERIGMMGGPGGPRDAMDDFGPRGGKEPIDDFDMRKSFTGANFSNRSMDMINRDRMDMPPRAGESPVVQEDEGEDLVILEERGFDRDQAWPPRNDRGGMVRGNVPPNNRAFRGRAAGYNRMQF